MDGVVQGAELRAIIFDATEPSKLAVGPIQLPQRFYGPYWIIAAGPGACRLARPPPPPLEATGAANQRCVARTVMLSLAPNFFLQTTRTGMSGR